MADESRKDGLSATRAYMRKRDPAFLDLVDRAFGGDRQAMHELVSRHEHKVRLVARYWLNKTSLRQQLDSVDIYQSVWRRIFQAGREALDLENADDLERLMNTIARNCVEDHRRHHAREQAETHNASPGALAQQPEQVPPEATPPALIADRDELDRILHGVPPDDRQLLQMHADGYSWKELAAVAGMTPDAVRMRVTRLLQRLRERWEGRAE